MPPMFAAFVQPTQPIPYHFVDDGAIPNNPALPLLVYPGVLRLTGADPAVIPEQIFAANGWGGVGPKGTSLFLTITGGGMQCWRFAGERRGSNLAAARASP